MRKSGLVFLILFLALGLYLSCGQKVEDSPFGNARGLDAANLDTTCDPCQDFFQYANGGWLAKYPVPEEHSSWGVTNEMRERNYVLLKEILDEAARMFGAETGSNWQLVGDYYFTAMDTTKIDADRAEPLQPVFDKIDAVSSPKELMSVVTEFHMVGQGAMFSAGPDQGLMDNTRYIIYAGQGGLGLPDRDYYTKEDSASQVLRDQYVEHIGNMFKLLGEADAVAQASAATVMAIETRLAQKSQTNVELRNPANWMDYMSVSDANALTPNINWHDYLTGVGQADMDSLSVTQHDFFAELSKMLTEVSLDDWKTYLKWHVTTRAAPFLSADFFDEDFRFYYTVLRGTEEPEIRWKRVLGSMNGHIGEALGQLFVERAFPPTTKARADEMITNVTTALHTRIENLEWMSDETKTKALAKLATFTPKIGYPDKWRDYSNLSIDRSSWINNVMAARAFGVQRQYDKIGKPVDKTEWGMPPQIINAYYNSQLNEIVFPAGIMQPPYFDGEIDDAINYGGMGAVIGHEISHGFDDQGSRFDADGNMINWWTDADRDAFETRTQAIIDQFNEFIPIDSLRINGELTQGENVGDLAGLLIAYGGLQIAMEGKEDPMVDGLTQDQRFFLSWAQVWRENTRDESLKLQINTDPHSPAKYRVIGPLANLELFQKAFGCKEGDKMVRAADKRVNIW